VTDEEKAQLAQQALIDQWQAAWRDLQAAIEPIMEQAAEIVRQLAAVLLPVLRRFWRWWNGYDTYRVPVPAAWYRVRVTAMFPRVLWMPARE
jgi:hypothetical protein